MKAIVKLTCGVTSAIVLLAAQAQAELIVDYTFNNGSTNSTLGITNSNPNAVGTAAWTNFVTTAVIGSSISSFSFYNPSNANLSILSSVSGNPNSKGFQAGNSVSQNSWTGNGSYFQFTLNATGYQDLLVAWTGNVSSSGPATNGFWYSADGGSSFTLFSTFRAPDNAVTVGIVTQNLTAVTALNNNANVIFRIYGTNVVGGVISPGGTMKIDNFTIEAVIPEPSTVLLVGVGLVGLLALRRRRS